MGCTPLPPDYTQPSAVDEYTFEVGGTVQLRENADAPWELKTFRVPEGPTILRWSYFGRVPSEWESVGGGHLWVDQFQFLPDGVSPKPEPPRNVRFTGPGLISWDASLSPDVIGYRVHWVVSTGNVTNTQDVGLQTHYLPVGLAPGTTLNALITCYSATTQESDPSNDVTYTVPFGLDNYSPPIGASQMITVRADSESLVVLSGYDPEGAPLVYTVTYGPRHGVVLDQQGSRVIYRPDGGYVGADEFSFAVSDGLLDSQPARVSMNVVSEPAGGLVVQSATPTEQGLRLQSTSVPGTVYRVLYKNSMADPEWSVLFDELRATDPILEIVDQGHSPSDARYYMIEAVR